MRGDIVCPAASSGTCLEGGQLVHTVAEWTLVEKPGAAGGRGCALTRWDLGGVPEGQVTALLPCESCRVFLKSALFP